MVTRLSSSVKSLGLPRARPQTVRRDHSESKRPQPHSNSVSEHSLSHCRLASVFIRSAVAVSAGTACLSSSLVLRAIMFNVHSRLWRCGCLLPLILLSGPRSHCCCGGLQDQWPDTSAHCKIAPFKHGWPKYGLDKRDRIFF